ncbi:uncharacterized protein LOC129717131 [Wyeomyia smithii]|uniref:uncharacterized protein LOC129717131 n=1 Tax=Wyeomyia smithii TaxID=174621 RepID=UPI002467B7F5|nr:uncharacterized protein LOC129717131 [Wyeomyia smithii]
MIRTTTSVTHQRLRPWMFFWIFGLLVEECRQVLALQLTDITVPDVVDYRATVTLSCSYDLGPHQLNSVKWYKGNQEFFRYAPMLSPKIKTFPVEGVVLANENLCHQHLCQIRLTNLERRSGGEYRCEISGDAPKFALANGSRNMTVEVLPQHDPIISGLAATYYPGETIEANCTSDMSSLATRLYFFVNEKAVPIEYLQPLQETTLESDSFVMRYRILEMHLPVDRLFPKGVDRTILHIKCIAAIDAVRTAGREATALVAVQSHRWSWIIGGMHSGTHQQHPARITAAYLPLLLFTINLLGLFTRTSFPFGF